MIRLIKKLDRPVRTNLRVTLTLDQRVRNRLRVRLDDGREAGIFLARGDRLQDGGCLISEEGLIVRVKAAREPVSTVLSQGPLALQIEPGRLRYPRDHVLDELVRGLGLEVIVEDAPIEPERGTYGGPGHAHGNF